MEDCFFYTTVKDKQTFVVPLCLGCRDKFTEIQCWFWEGSVRGYGPFDFKCEKCGVVIHQGKKDIAK